MTYKEWIAQGQRDFEYEILVWPRGTAEIFRRYTDGRLRRWTNAPNLATAIAVCGTHPTTIIPRRP